MYCLDFELFFIRVGKVIKNLIDNEIETIKLDLLQKNKIYNFNFNLNKQLITVKTI